MRMEELRQLANRLYPKGQCRFVRPGITQASAISHAPFSPDGRSVDEIFDDIRKPGSWVALYNVEKDARYREFLAEVQAAFKPLIVREQGRLLDVGGFIFISAPPSVTPFHIDRENNFWLQIHGRKRMTVWDPGPDGVVDIPAVENFIVTRDLSQVRFEETMRPLAHEFDTVPGDGVYFPSTSPHMTYSGRDWVAPGDEVCVSIGVVFYTELTRRHARVHAFNRMARRVGFSPRPPGESPVRDHAKSLLGGAMVRARARIGRYALPPGL